MKFEQSLFKTEMRRDALVASTMGWKGGEEAQSEQSVESVLGWRNRRTGVSGGVSIFPSPQAGAGGKKRREKKAVFARGGGRTVDLQ